MTSDRFLVLSNSVLKVKSEKNYSKFGLILEVTNEVAVKTWMLKKCIADDTNTSNTFIYFYFIYLPLTQGFT